MKCRLDGCQNEVHDPLMTGCLCREHADLEWMARKKLKQERPMPKDYGKVFQAWVDWLDNAVEEVLKKSTGG